MSGAMVQLSARYAAQARLSTQRFLQSETEDTKTGMAMVL